MSQELNQNPDNYQSEPASDTATESTLQPRRGWFNVVMNKVSSIIAGFEARSALARQNEAAGFLEQAYMSIQKTAGLQGGILEPEWHSGIIARPEEVVDILRWYTRFKTSDALLTTEKAQQALALTGKSAADFPPRAKTFADMVVTMDNLAPTLWRRRMLQLEANDWQLGSPEEIMPLISEGEMDGEVVADFMEGLEVDDEFEELATGFAAMFKTDLGDPADTQLIKRIFWMARAYGYSQTRFDNSLWIGSEEKHIEIPFHYLEIRDFGNDFIEGRKERLEALLDKIDLELGA
jgi:hypothetical protein